MFCSSYVACKVFGLYNSFLGIHETPCMIIVPLRFFFFMYDHKNIPFVAVETYALTLEPRFVLELTIWGADEDSFRRDILLKGIEGLKLV